jgi:hypothetical protein
MRAADHGAGTPDKGVTTHVAVLDALRWGSKADELAAAGEIVDYSGGTLIIRGCWFGTGTPDLTEYTFRYGTTQPEGDFIFEDCRVRRSMTPGSFPIFSRHPLGEPCCISAPAMPLYQCRLPEPPQKVRGQPVPRSVWSYGELPVARG